jgi:hypothetical protein
LLVEIVFAREELGKDRRVLEDAGMPPRRDGLTPENWDASKYGQALKFMQKCNDNAADPSCIWADVPRGNFNNPKVDR